MLKSAGICRQFWDNWTASVPVLVKYAIKTKKKGDALSQLFYVYGEDVITQSFGNASTL